MNDEVAGEGGLFYAELAARMQASGLAPTRENVKRVGAEMLIERGVQKLAGEVDAEFERLVLAGSGEAPLSPEEEEPVAMQEFRDTLRELESLGEPTPAQLRRIAELTEIVHDDAAARPWWERAAAAGDEEAVDYLAGLRAENEG